MENKAYRFAIYSTPITFPLCFAVHTWIVLQSPEFGTHRYEIHCFKNSKSGNHFYINNVPEKQGMAVFGFLRYWKSTLTFPSTCLYETGGEDSKELILHIEGILWNYSYLNKYRAYPGPNSNTFTQWVIQKTGLQDKIRLPWNAFGKNYK